MALRSAVPKVVEFALVRDVLSDTALWEVLVPGGMVTVKSTLMFDVAKRRPGIDKRRAAIVSVALTQAAGTLSLFAIPFSTPNFTLASFTKLAADTLVGKLATNLTSPDTVICLVPGLLLEGGFVVVLVMLTTVLVCVMVVLAVTVVAVFVVVVMVVMVVVPMVVPGAHDSETGSSSIRDVHLGPLGAFQ